MSDSTASTHITLAEGLTITSAADLATLRKEGKALTPQQLRELNARIKTLEEMAIAEDRLRKLENRKHPRDEVDDEDQDIDDNIVEAEEIPDHQLVQEAALVPPEPLEPPREPVTQQPSVRGHQHLSRDSDSSDSTSTITYHRYKRQRYTKGIKITPSYKLKITSGLREWGDWKKDMERVFQGDPSTYRMSVQRILKALDYVNEKLKSL